jgi:hypothetical protein
VVIELWAVEAFFVFRLLVLVSSSWLVLSMLEMQVTFEEAGTAYADASRNVDIFQSTDMSDSLS